MNNSIFLSLIVFLFTSIGFGNELEEKQKKVYTLIKSKLANHYYIDSNLVNLELNETKTKELLTKVKSDIQDIRIVRIDERINKFLATIYTNSDIYYTEGSFKFVNLRPIAKKNINKDQILDKSLVEFKQEYVESIKQINHNTTTELLGYKAKVYIPQNNVITKDNLEKAYVIKKNDQVQVVYKNKNINIKTTGTAQEDGAIGEYVKIKSDTDIFLKGKVTDSKIVEIE